MKRILSDAANTPATPEIQIVWTGSSWQCEFPADTAALRPGTRFGARMLDNGGQAPAVPTAVDPQLMFPRDTVLYMPIEPAAHEAELRAITDQCCAATPGLRKAAEGKELVPIRLLDDLHLGKEGKTRMAGMESCRCRIDGGPDREFRSVNAVATFALKRWQPNRVPAVDAFHGVSFLDQGRLLPLDKHRDLVLHGTAYPEPRLDPGHGTPHLPGLDLPADRAP